MDTDISAAQKVEKCYILHPKVLLRITNCVIKKSNERFRDFSEKLPLKLFVKIITFW